MSDFKPLDPTACGLLLVAAISLPLAAAQLGLDGTAANPYLFQAAGIIIGIGGLAAYRAENNLGFTTFMIVAAALFLSGKGMLDWDNVLFAILFIVCAVWGVFIKVPWTLVAILVLSALIFTLIGLTGILDADYAKVIGALALVNFVLCVYLGFALGTGKVPAI